MKIKNSSILKKGSMYLFGNLFNKAITFITIPIFTRILTSEEFGIINTYTSWVSLLSVIIGLSFGDSIRNAYIDKNKELEKYISTIFATSGVFFIFICICYYFISSYIKISNTIVWLCLLESFFSSIINSLIYKYMMEENAKKRTLLIVIPNLMGVILALILIQILYDDKYYGKIIATCLSTSFFGLYIMIYYFFKYNSFIKKEYILYALPISIPLVFHGISMNVLSTSDRSIISYYCGSSEAGIYSLIYNFSMIINVIVSSLSAIWIPRFTRDMIRKDYIKINKELKIYINIMLLPFFILIAMSPEFIIFLGGEEYLKGLDMVLPIILSSYIVFIYGIYVNVEYYYKNTKIIALSTLLSAILNLILNVIFVPIWGALAAAYTTLISYGLNFYLHKRVANKIDNNVMKLKMILIPTIIIFCYGIIISFFYNNLLFRYIIILIICGSYCYKYRSILSFIK